MEEMRGAAMAYYANMSDDLKEEVLSFFMLLDKNGDGEVSIQEYKEFVKELGDGFNPANLFKFLDKNNDGTLDFEECITLFYMLFGKRIVMCDGCGCFLWGLHFLCVECYKADGNTFDLCTSCYRNKKYNHGHAHFLDNYALLRMKPWKDDTSEPVDSRKEKVTTREKVDGSVSKRAAIKEAIEDLNMGFDIGEVVAGIEDLNMGFDIGEVVASVADSPAVEFVATAAEIVAAAGIVAAAACTIM